MKDCKKVAIQQGMQQNVCNMFNNSQLQANLSNTEEYMYMYSSGDSCLNDGMC